MKAAFLEGIGKELQVKDIDIPKPGQGEMVIRQSSTGICYRDLLTQEGFFPRAKFPLIPGHEISGTITEIGENVTAFKPGDRVSSLIYRPCGTCEYCVSGRENLCPHKKIYGENLPGSYSEYVVVHQDSCVKVPDEVDDHEAAIAACVTGMVMHALTTVGGLKKGQTLLVTGAGGGVGIHAVQIGKILGAHVIAETSSDKKIQQIKDAGADSIIKMSERFDRDVKNLVDGGVDIALETTGIYTFVQSLRSLNFGGKLVVIGNIKPDPVPLPLGLIILKGNTISGSISSTKEDLRKALELSRKDSFRAIAQEKHIDKVNDAFQAIRNRESQGRVFLGFR